MTSPKLYQALDRFTAKKIGVVGDLIWDHYITGEVERISPEAPVPVVMNHREFGVPGGAGNVAANIQALGGEAWVVGVVGKDISGETLLVEFATRGIHSDGVVRLGHRPTTQKTRVLVRGQQVLRVDRETAQDIDADARKALVRFIRAHLPGWDAVAISDYAKGMFGTGLMRDVIRLARRHRKPVVGDIKPAHRTEAKGMTLLAPNAFEAAGITGLRDVQLAGKAIQRRLHCDVVITQGNRGMTLFIGKRVEHFPTQAREVFDVTGAGDTVVAALVLSLAAKLSMRDAVRAGNCAAGIVVGKHGTATVSLTELKQELRKQGSVAA
ncbi:bifunctional hydroxymethylpyrimidine kinase/phosphomethylpyrimidine kinase [Candidatus Parcubacteria bacterium]|nr:bifunctional hydroxymethylpyrimidine kinase/phosphomethylpyrimidine kinase [Candidatus Parcubacteria bacterium]